MTSNCFFPRFQRHGIDYNIHLSRICIDSAIVEKLIMRMLSLHGFWGWVVGFRNLSGGDREASRREKGVEMVMKMVEMDK
jgi:hypothetical protein